MKKTLFTLICVAIVGGLIGWLSVRFQPQPEENIGGRTTPIIETPRYIGALTDTFGGVGTASTTVSWSGGDIGRLMVNSKFRWATLTAEFQLQFSNNGTTWYDDMLITASSTVGQMPTTTVQVASRIFKVQHGDYRATSSDSFLVDGLRNSPFIRVLSRKPTSDNAEDVEVDFFLIKEEQQ